MEKKENRTGRTGRRLGDTKVNLEYRHKRLVQLVLEGYSYTKLLEVLRDEYDLTARDTTSKAINRAQKEAYSLRVADIDYQQLKKDNLERLEQVVNKCLPEIETNNKSRETLIRAVESINKLFGLSSASEADKLNSEIVFNFNTPKI